MPLALYLDDCAFSHPLRILLQQNGHTVTVPADVGLTGRDDDEHLAYAVGAGLIVVTKNPADFLELHEQRLEASQSHPGIFAVYQDNDITKDMSDAAIVAAIANVQTYHGQQQADLANQFFVLNHYR